MDCYIIELQTNADFNEYWNKWTLRFIDAASEQDAKEQIYNNYGSGLKQIRSISRCGTWADFIKLV